MGADLNKRASAAESWSPHEPTAYSKSTQPNFAKAGAAKSYNKVER